MKLSGFFEEYVTCMFGFMFLFVLSSLLFRQESEERRLLKDGRHLSYFEGARKSDRFGECVAGIVEGKRAREPLSADFNWTFAPIEGGMVPVSA